MVEEVERRICATNSIKSADRCQGTKVWGGRRRHADGSEKQPPGIASTRDTAEEEGEGDCVDKANEDVNTGRDGASGAYSNRTVRKERKVVRIDGGKGGACN